MPYPIFKKGQPGSQPDTLDRFGSPSAEQIPTLSRDKLDDPRSYVMSKELSDAVNVSLLLGMPLLVTGEPGSGKTELGRAIAYELSVGEPLRFETKSTSQAKDLFYTFDVLGRYGAKDLGATMDPRAYITYSALGRAILDTFNTDQVHHLLPVSTSKRTHAGPKRSVVIIDEIDKAPRDFPNDLLNEIDRMAFRVPELGAAATPGMDDAASGVPPTLRPIVVITSNSEKTLPEPFLRRCVYFNIPLPDDAQLRKIIASRMSRLTGTCPLVNDVIDLFRQLRSQTGRFVLQTQPSTAELLAFLRVLTYRGYGEIASVKNAEALPDLLEGLGTLIKQREDEPLARRAVEDWCIGNVEGAKKPTAQ